MFLAYNVAIMHFLHAHKIANIFVLGAEFISGGYKVWNSLGDVVGGS